MNKSNNYKLNKYILKKRNTSDSYSISVYNKKIRQYGGTINEFSSHQVYNYYKKNFIEQTKYNRLCCGNQTFIAITKSGEVKNVYDDHINNVLIPDDIKSLLNCIK